MYTRRSVSLPVIWHFCKWHVFMYAAWSAVVYVVYKYLNFKFLGIPFLPIATIGTAVAFYVGFKNHSSYERLWEARKIWGGVTNTSRSFAVSVVNLVRSKSEARDKLATMHRELIYRQLAWINMLRIELRKYNPWTEKDQDDLPQVLIMRKLNFPLDQEQNQDDILNGFLEQSERDALAGRGKASIQLLSKQLGELTRLKDSELIDHYEHQNMMMLIVNCFDLQGAAERINSFPFPRQYANFSSVFVNIFNFLLPFGLIPEFDKIDHGLVWLAIPFSVLISWIFITMEQVGDSSENPFETGLNDVPMTAICRNIEIDLRNLLGEEDIPAPVAPVGSILL